MKSPVRYMTLDDNTFDKWGRWLGKIEEDVSTMVNNQQIYKHFINVVNANIEHINLNEGSLFCTFVRQCYGVQSATAIRRHIKGKDDDI
jgi:hypothetical protein